MRAFDPEDLDLIAPARADWRDADDCGFIAAARERMALVLFIVTGLSLAGVALHRASAYLQAIAAALP
ncbi:MAG TPA: hypothetical protein VGD94_12345 [Vicinamibacterales bacterium]